MNFFCGRGPHEDMWVFGIVDTSHTPALGYMEVVQRRDCCPLYKHMCKKVEVHSDQWQAYRQVSTLQQASAHQTINHLVNFFDPAIGIHMQHVESYWNRVKLKVKSMKEMPHSSDFFLP